MMYKTEKITIDGKDITIKPLTGKYFAKFMKAASKMPQDESAKDFDEEAIAAFHELGVASIKDSFKDLSPDEIEFIVTSNFATIIKVVASVNTPNN